MLSHDYRERTKLTQLTPVSEEISQQRFGALAADTAIDFRLVMTGGLGEENRAVFNCAHFFIRCRIIQSSDAGEGNGGGAHGAGFKRHVDIAIDQAFRAQFGGHFPDDQHFGMGGGVMVSEGPVSGNRQNIT